MITQAEIDSMRMHITRQDWIIERQKELLDIQRELILLLVNSGVRLNPSELANQSTWDPTKWKYDPGPTCEYGKGD